MNRILTLKKSRRAWLGSRAIRLRRRFRPAAEFFSEWGVPRQLNRARAWLHLKQGARCDARKDWPNAARHYLKSAAHGVVNAEAHYRAAAAFEAAGEMEAAKQAYLEAFRLDPAAPPILERVFAGTVRDYKQRRAMVDFVIGVLPAVRARACAEIAASERIAPGSVAPLRVFSYWGQGFDQAPAVVRACQRELLRHHRPEEVQLLDKRDIEYYADLPQGLAARIGTNKAHFSDMLRIALLAKWGGVWADATCLVTENLLSRFGDLVGTSGFYAFPRGKDGHISNWFLASAPGNYVTCMMKHALLAYWEHHDRAVTYHFFHQIFRILYLADAKFQRTWDTRSPITGDPRVVQRRMFEPLTQAQLLRLLKGCFVHKLTHKTRGGVTPGTALASIVRGEI